MNAAPGPFGALLELRARLLLRRLRGAGGTVELVARLLIWALAIPAAIGCAIVAGLVSYRALRGQGSALAGTAAAGLFFGVWQAWTAIALSVRDREALELRRFLVYPIPPARVYGWGVVASVAGDPFSLLFALLLAGAGAGAAFARPGAWLLLLAATTALFVVATALVVALLEELVARLARRRRLRVVAIGAVYLAVGLVVSTMVAGPRALFEGLELAGRFRWILWPPAFATAATVRLYAGDVPGALGWLAGLAALSAVTGVVAFRLALASAQSGGEGRAAANASARGGWRLDRLPGRFGALLEKDAKVLARHPLSGVLAIVVAALGAFAGAKGTPSGSDLVSGELARALPILGFAVYAHLVSQVFWLNAFGWDRAGARVAFLAPVRPAEVLAAKNAAVFGLSFSLFLAGALPAAALGGTPSAWAIAGALLVHAGLAPWLLAAGNVVSILAPRAMRLTLHRGARLPAASTLAGFAIVSAGLALFAAPLPFALLLERPALLLLGWAGLGGAGLVVWGVSLRPAGLLLARRREAVLAAVGGDDA